MIRYGAMANVVIRKPAEDPLEEVYRAVTEVWASVGLLVKCGNEYWEAITDRLGGVPVSEWGEAEIPDRSIRVADVRERVPRSFEWFRKACPRAAGAIVRIDWGPLGISPTPVLGAIAELRRLFPEPVWQPAEDLPGHHLLMDGSILGISSRRSSRLEHHRADIDELRLILERFAGAMGVFMDAGVKVRLTTTKQTSSPPDSVRLSGAQSAPIDAVEFQLGSWFEAATSNGLTRDRLQRAASRDRLKKSRKGNGGSWLHSTIEVAHVYTEFAGKIQAAVDKLAGRTRSDTDTSRQSQT